MSLRTVEKVLLWYAGQAHGLAKMDGTDPVRIEELKEMERICRKLVEKKPETFREAIQLVIIYTLLDGAREWGRMDDYLGYYVSGQRRNGGAGWTRSQYRLLGPAFSAA